MDLDSISLTTIDGAQTTFGAERGKATLVVNVASKCGNTPQYEGLERIFEKYRDRGLQILAFPCNQFMFQEPGTSAQIKEFCELTYGVKFPLFEKIKVNGKDAHPLYEALKQTQDGKGNAGDIQWNFEKFLVSDSGEVQRFRPKVEPEDDAIIQSIESALNAA